MPTFRRCSITYREKDRPFLSICDSIKENKLRENDHYLQLQRERQAFSESLWLTAWDVSKSKRTNSEKMIITYSYREKDRPFLSLCDSLHEMSQSQREQTQRKWSLLTVTERGEQTQRKWSLLTVTERKTGLFGVSVTHCMRYLKVRENKLREKDHCLQTESWSAECWRCPEPSAAGSLEPGHFAASPAPLLLVTFQMTPLSSKRFCCCCCNVNACT